jgi:4-diphosphocytidyl-2-C-methyl-D-erythritol kinase
MKLSAPAKINLALDIVGRRPDGYHTLDMVMQSVSLADTVSLERTETDSIELQCGEKDVPCGPENTVLRAANAFFHATKVERSCGLLFCIEKRIPRQAGLGGGSADAAAAILLLNDAYRTGLSLEKLMKIGLSAGADVPFCIAGGTARVRGIGEIIEPIAVTAEYKIVICRPDVGISTKEAYDAFDRKKVSSGDRHTDQVLRALKSGRLKELGSALGNAFEDADVPREIIEIEKEMLRQGAAGACMTGSGSAVFGLFEGKPEAERCCEVLRKRYAAVFLCHPISQRSVSGEAISGPISYH